MKFYAFEAPFFYIASQIKSRIFCICTCKNAALQSCSKEHFKIKKKKYSAVGIHLSKYTVKSFLVSLEYYCGVDFIPLWQFLVSPAFVAFLIIIPFGQRVLVGLSRQCRNSCINIFAQPFGFYWMPFIAALSSDSLLSLRRWKCIGQL